MWGMLPGHVVYSFITLFRIPVCWFVLQSTAFCSAVGKERNQTPGERSDVDIDKLGLSLSIYLNDTDTQVGSLEEVVHTQNPGAYAASAAKGKKYTSSKFA